MKQAGKALEEQGGKVLLKEGESAERAVAERAAAERAVAERAAAERGAAAEQAAAEQAAVIPRANSPEVQSAIAQNSDVYNLAQSKYLQKLSEIGNGSFDLAEEVVNEAAQENNKSLSEQDTQLLAIGVFGYVAGSSNSNN
jgi:hypothetical protein